MISNHDVEVVARNSKHHFDLNKVPNEIVSTVGGVVPNGVSSTDEGAATLKKGVDNTFKVIFQLFTIVVFEIERKLSFLVCVYFAL